MKRKTKASRDTGTGATFLSDGTDKDIIAMLAEAASAGMNDNQYEDGTEPSVNETSASDDDAEEPGAVLFGSAIAGVPARSALWSVPPYVMPH